MTTANFSHMGNISSAGFQRFVRRWITRTKFNVRHRNYNSSGFVTEPHSQPSIFIFHRLAVWTNIYLSKKSAYIQTTYGTPRYFRRKILGDFAYACVIVQANSSRATSSSTVSTVGIRRQSDYRIKAFSQVLLFVPCNGWQS